MRHPSYPFLTPMTFAFKKGQKVKTKKRFWMGARHGSGPNIPKGTEAIVLKRYRASTTITVDFGLKDGIGRRHEDARNFVAV